VPIWFLISYDAVQYLMANGEMEKMRRWITYYNIITLCINLQYKIEIISCIVFE
jgi:hypothetical protein